MEISCSGEKGNRIDFAVLQNKINSRMTANTVSLKAFFLPLTKT